MSDLIERDKVAELFKELFEQGALTLIGNDYLQRKLDAIPSADAVSLEEFEQMRFLADKSMEMVGEERPKGEWTSVLAELHEQFSVLEKEIRKASAEMSAIIRANLDRPKGEQIAIGTVCEVICKHCIKANGYCQHRWKCPLLTEIAKLIESKDKWQEERSE